MRSMSRTVLCIGLMSLACACGSSTASQPGLAPDRQGGGDPENPGGQGDPGVVDIRGKITNVRAHQDSGSSTLGVIMIEGKLEDDTRHDKASVTVTQDTQIFDRSAGGTRAVSFQALKTSQTVEALFTGPVGLSYPVQATATRIDILK